MKQQKLGWSGLRAAGVALLLAPLTAAAGLTVNNGWVRAMPPGQSVTALYFEVVNHAEQACVLSAVETPAAARTELHRTVEEEGMARMRHQETLEVASHATLQLRPGGDHVMLFDVIERLEPGMTVMATLDFGDCGTRELEAEVRDTSGARRDNDHAGHSHHHHH